MEILFAALHVIAAVFIVGPMAILPMTAMRAVRARNGAQVQALARATSTFTLLSLLVLLTGFILIEAGDPKNNVTLSTGWIIGSIMLYVIAVAINLFITVPSMKRVADGVTASTGAEGMIMAARPAGYSTIAGASGLASLLLVAVVVLMVWKP